MRTLLVLPYLNVYLHEGTKPVLELKWRCYATSADFRACVSQALQLSLQHGAKRWVVDDRLQGAIRPRDLEWSAQEILVPLDQNGLERLAQLESQDALNRRTVDAMYKLAMPTLHFETRRFEDLAQARAWASGS